MDEPDEVLLAELGRGEERVGLTGLLRGNHWFLYPPGPLHQGVGSRAALVELVRATRQVRLDAAGRFEPAEPAMAEPMERVLSLYDSLADESAMRWVEPRSSSS